MELPTEPTILPDARRFPRTFEADTRVTYYEQSVIEIQIPPMDRTYLTKENYLEFEMDLSYSPGTTAEWTNIFNRAVRPKDNALGAITETSFKNGFKLLGETFMYVDTSIESTYSYNYGAKSSNVLVKPMPYFDTNGPHGLFRKLQVYDFRGTTLLEEIDNYDIITALFHHQDRPRFSTDDQGLKVPPACSIYDTDTFAEEARSGAPISIDLAYLPGDFPWEFTVATIQAPDIVCDTQRYTLNLYSFLHSLSQKFVPLHNGFTLRLTVNKPEKCISLSTPYMYNNINVYGTNYPLTPAITQFSLKNAKLVTDLLEIPSELDAQVTKDIHARAFHYQLGNTKLHRNVKSLTNLFVQWRPKYENTPIYAEKLAYRVNAGPGKLMFDGSVLKQFKTTEEAFQEAQRLLEPTINRSDFLNVDNIPLSQCYGVTQSQLATWNVVGRVTETTVVDGTKEYYYYEDSTSYGLPLDQADKLEDISLQGKYVEAYDLRLPGTTQSAVDGIDTSKAVIEYIPGTTNNYAQFEIIADFDAFIRIEPGKSSSVAF